MIFIENGITNSWLLLSHFFLHLSIVFTFFFNASLLFSIPPFVGLDVGDYVDIGPVDIFKCTSSWVDSNTHCFVNSSYFNPVTWLHIVNEIFISTKVNCLRSLSFWYTFRCFLNFHMLLVREHALVEYHLESISLVTVLTESWLLDATILGNSLLFTMAFHTLKFCFFHFRHNITVADNNTSQCNKLVDMVWAQLSDPINFP